MSKTPRPERLVKALLRRKLAATKEEAHTLILEGRVQVERQVITSPTAQVTPEKLVTLVPTEKQWVGRGAYKLLGALDALDLHPEGWVAADFGASTGGFTEALLHHGAKKVYAIDVGKGLLAWSLVQDTRVVVMDSCNVRHLTTLPEPLDFIVGDLSFISLSQILPTVKRLLGPNGCALMMVKPQFEAPSSDIIQGGKLRDETARLAAIQRIRDSAEGLGFTILGSVDSTLPGAKSGNIEHFLHLVMQ
jgi:23S rRNA (cytidine1920-2'-O)/16S rRNA (cytidine1409-2'-O)-methyltransferase